MIEGVDIFEAKMMRAPVDAIDDCTGLFGEFVLKTVGDKPPDDRRMVGGGSMSQSSYQPSIKQSDD